MRIRSLISDDTTPLKRLRISRGLSQVALAVRANVHLSTISLAERSGRMTHETAEKIATAFGMGVAALNALTQPPRLP